MNRALWKMPAGGNGGKRTARFPLFPRRLGNLAKAARFPHFHSAGDYLIRVQGRAEAEELVCGGKVEIQKQDSHFPTAPMACGARKETDCYRSKKSEMLTNGSAIRSRRNSLAR